MEITKTSTGLETYSNTDAAKSNVVLIRPSKAEPPVTMKSSQVAEDRFTSSSLGNEPSDGIADTFTLTSAGVSACNASAREAKVASIISAVQNGTYRVDSKAVANALISKMLVSADDLAQDGAPEKADEAG